MNFLGINEDNLSDEDKSQLKEITDKIIQEGLQMECPICRTKLVLGNGTKRYETLSDHVCDPNGTIPERPYFECPNEKCAIYKNSFFDEQGEFYTNLPLKEMCKAFNHTIEDYLHYQRNKNTCHAAYNSFGRKCWFETTYKEQTKHFFIGKFKYGFYLYFQMKADRYGNIIQRKPKIQLLKKEDDGIGVIHYIPGIHMFFYDLKETKRKYNTLFKNPTIYHFKELQEACNPNYWTNKGEWWRVWSCKINGWRYNSFIKNIENRLEEEKNKNSIKDIK